MFHGLFFLVGTHSWSTIWQRSMLGKHYLHGLSGILRGWQTGLLSIRPFVHPSIRSPIRLPTHFINPSNLPSCPASTPPPRQTDGEGGGGSFINNADLVLVQKHYCEGNEKEKIIDTRPNEQEYKSQAVLVCHWSRAPRQTCTKHRISLCLRGATRGRCVYGSVCTPEFPVVRGLGSRNTNGQQLRPVALVGVNERDRGWEWTKEGLKGKARGGRIWRFVLTG